MTPQDLTLRVAAHVMQPELFGRLCELVRACASWGLAVDLIDAKSPEDAAPFDIALLESAPAGEASCNIVEAWQRRARLGQVILIASGPGSIAFDEALTVYRAFDFIGQDELTAETLYRSLRAAKSAHHTTGEARHTSRSSDDIGKGSIRDIAGKISDGILILDQAGVIEYANRAAQKLLGLASESGDAVPFGLPVSSSDTMELEIMGPAKSVVTAELRFGRIEWHGAEKTLVTIRDISRHKRLISEVVEAKRQAEIAAHHKSEFLARMSHEIRTPLNGVIGMSSLLLESGLADEQVAFAESIRSSGNMLLSVINDILDFSKIEAGKASTDSVPFDLRRLIEEVNDIFAPQVTSRQIVLADIVDCRIPDRLLGDPGRIKQILTNLVGNSIKFTDQGRVVVRAFLAASSGDTLTVRLGVEDTGHGITGHLKEHIFEPFTQADTSSSRKHGGTGLGLAITKKLVELMQGRIDFDSEAGQGTKFVAEIPFGIARDTDSPEGACTDPQRLFKKVLVIGEDLHFKEVVAQQIAMEYGGAVTVGFAAQINEALTSDFSADTIVLDARAINLETFGSGALFNWHVNRQPNFRSLIVCGLGKRPSDVRALPGEILEVGALHQRRLIAALSQASWPRQGAQSEGTPQKEVGQADGFVATSHTGAPTVLVAEDNDVNQKVMTHMLRRLGADCEIANNGLAALAMLNSRSYDLLFLDCEMPGMDGFEVARRIRRQGGDAGSIPIIAVTAYALSGDRERCIAAGMDDYLSKPVQIGNLREMMTKWLGRDRSVRESIGLGLVGATAFGGELLDETIVASLFDIDGPEFVEELIRVFEANMCQLLPSLRNAVREGDLTLLRRLAHTIKGSSGNLGAATMMGVARKMEEAADKADLAACSDLFTELEMVFDQTSLALDSLLDKGSAPQ